MTVWIRRFRFLLASPRPALQLAPALLTGDPPTPARAGVPPITDLDLLRALGCDV